MLQATSRLVALAAANSKEFKDRQDLKAQPEHKGCKELPARSDQRE
jgi:hypothetical protein